jgi:hypothetical protein
LVKRNFSGRRATARPFRGRERQAIKSRAKHVRIATAQACLPREPT